MKLSIMGLMIGLLIAIYAPKSSIKIGLIVLFILIIILAIIDYLTKRKHKK